MQYLRLLLLPFSLLYGVVIWLRNYLYDIGLFKSAKFDLPVISIGNLAIGGAGKTPMAEYIIRLLKDKHKVAVLSRGYKRETKGFRIVNKLDSVSDVGDEPLQFRRKFDEITVAVSEKRVLGIEALQSFNDVIILDDAFQHRAVKPGLSILLFDYTRLSDFLFILPAGNLREPFSNRKRADVIVISKCPAGLSEKQKQEVISRIKPVKAQQLFFSYLEYANLVQAFDDSERALSKIKQADVFLLTGIANPYPLLEKLQAVSKSVVHHDYPDHHNFSTKNISKLAEEFKAAASADKVIITTEKDSQRLQLPAIAQLLKDLPVYYLPVAARFHQADELRFNQIIENYASEHLQHNTIH